MIELSHVSKTYPGTIAPAVGDLSLAVPAGETVVLVGPSGCGKTTTLKMINRLIEPTSGTITVGGRNVFDIAAHDLRREIGYVIQQIGLFPHRTIADNIATVPRLLGWDKQRTTRRVAELTELVDLDEEMLPRYPAELSGGQRQRVCVARALAADPPVLLMDEPFGAVDPIVRARLQDELVDLQARLRKTIVLVTHDIDEAIKLGDRVAILDVGGVLEQYAPPADLLRDPANEFVADFLGSDRGIKRLSLIPVSSVELIDGPVLGQGASRDDAEAMMRRFEIDWVAVGGDGTLAGWLGRDDLAGRDDISGITLRPFRTRLDVTDSLKEALDAVISSHTAVAAVFERDRYVGMITTEAISREIVQ